MKKIFALIVALLAGSAFAISAQGATAFVIGQRCAFGLGYHAHDMHAAVNAAHYYCKKHRCINPKLRGSARGHGYSAIAVGTSHKGCHYGFALNQPTRQNAINLALKHCAKYGHCKVKSWYFK